MTILNRAAAVTVAAFLALTGAPPIDLAAVRSMLFARPAFIAGAAA